MGIAHVYVAVVLPYSDGSSETQVIGVFTDEVQAQAALWRHTKEVGYPEQTTIIRKVLNGVE